MADVSFAELIRPAGSRAVTETNLPVYSVTKHAGFVPSLEYFKKQVFSRDVAGYKVVEPGNFAYATIHLDEGSIGIAPERSLISPMYTVFSIDDSRVDPGYLLRFLKSPRAMGHYPQLGKGAVHRRKAISLAALGTLQVPLPGLTEQRRIAWILDHAEALRAKRRQVLAQLNALTQAIFHEMFGAIGPDTELGRVCTRITDGTHQSPAWVDAGIPFLFVSNIASGEIELNTQKFISEPTWYELTRRTPIELGDVLYSTVGSYGIPAVVRTPERFAFQRHIAHIKPDGAYLVPDFLASQLASPALKRQAQRAARGIAQPTVNLAEIKRFRISVPPLAQQEEFARRAAALHVERATVSRALGIDDELFRSLQSRAFGGEL